ncbi:Inner membrane protein translocase and chaperone YidC, long form [hydrothermal vent metagenome]|uniref:Membrane protein insertase YidC n=1 Tax=hydrothermal vent metagenome TaxID=652676 RepID=A0A3B1BIG3_9ZZZZ
MDNIRILLFGALAFCLLLIWQAWQRDYGPQPQPIETTAQAPATQGVATPAAVSDGTIPEVQVAPGAPDIMAPTAAPKTEVITSAVSISVKTDLLDVEISAQGGEIKNVYLRKYPNSLLTPDDKFQLMTSNLVNRFIAQSGLIGADKETAPNHEAMYRVAQQELALSEGEDTLEAVLYWTHPSGIKITKRYIFQRGSYEITLHHEIENGSNATWSAREYRQLQRARPPESQGSSFIYTYTGAAIYSPEEKYEKYSFDDMDDAKLSRDVTGGWITMMQHYFLGAWIPPVNERSHYYSSKLAEGRYLVGMYSPLVSVAEGASHSFTSKLFIGPKLQQEMEDTAPGLELTVDYGWLTFLAKPIYWLLQKMYSLSNNWGWAIIFLTILIKAGFYKLSEASYKSMANMRKLAPRMQALKDRYGDDKAAMNQAMMKMYKQEKINPLGGCLPILVQIPVFIALYWVLLESVELRQAPFILWITDLSAKDPYFVLPVIMAASMFIQQKLNPAPLDPVQAKVMMSLPFVFGIFFAFFPSGLVLYWVVNNLISITQQWFITKKIEQEVSKKSK